MGCAPGCAAVAHVGREAPRFVGTVGARLGELLKALGTLGEPSTLLIVYEAGPCGYALVRELRAKDYRCEVVAPSLIARKPGERIKTDRRDALTACMFHERPDRPRRSKV